VSGEGCSVTNCAVTNGAVMWTGLSGLLTHSRIIGGSLSVVTTNTVARGLVVQGGSVGLAGINNTLEKSLVVASGATAVNIQDCVNCSVRNNTIVGSITAFSHTGQDSQTALENNILVADGSLAEAFCIRWDGGLLLSDYNDFVARNGAWIGNRNGHWERLLYWQRESGQDAHSFVADPLFANELGGDYHLKSVAGRYLNGAYTNDTVHSPAIDAGNPFSDYFEEPSPNGARVNVGAYADTLQASLSRTSSALIVMAPNDGGVVKGSNVVLRWQSSGLTTANTVTLQYSFDGGTTWTTMVSGLNASNRQYTWNSTTATSSLNATWRILVDGNTGVVDLADANFALRNVPLNFYVNDASTNGDVFTATNGSAAFNGLTPQSPMLSLSGLLTNYDLEGLDTVFIDTGTYGLTSDVVVIWSDGGDAAGNLLIRGSHNYAAGGSVFSRGSTTIDDDAFEVRGSRIRIRDLSARNAYRGVLMNSNTMATLERMLLYSNEFGIVDYKTQGVTNRNLRVWNNRQGGIEVVEASTTFVENCTFVGNAGYGVSLANSESNVVQNNIFYLTVTNSVALLDEGSNSAINAAFVDYNVYFMVTNTAIYGSFTSLPPWQKAMSNDFRSAITNPLFFNVASGDFHLRSQAGRYQDSLGGFTNDTTTSWAIDAGNPYSSYTNEPATNGNRVNIGAYGNTEYASKGTTNAGVFARVLNDPTTVSTNDNPMALIWSSRNTPSGATVRVEYSGDGGLTWVTLATNVPAEQEYVFWSLSPLYNTYNRGRWRVIGEGANPYQIGDTNNAPIDLFFGQFAIANQVKSTNQSFNTITWRGAWGENYQVQYAETRNVTNLYFMWSNAMDGVSAIQDASFLSTFGGDFTYEDPTSTGRPFRLYRVILNQYE
jgi:parallel beta-helix repeat protein